MRYCSLCKRLSRDGSLFCNHCGRSFNVRLCPRLHENTRDAKVCASCGSIELSTPAPRRSKLFFLASSFALALYVSTLAFLSVAYIATYIKVVFVEQGAALPMLIVGFLLGLLWLALVSFPTRGSTGRGKHTIRK
jgi:hypothetical protein